MWRVVGLSFVATFGLWGCRKDVVKPSGSIEAPRLVGPLSGTELFTAKPQFRVELAAKSDGAEIEICSDAECKTIIERIETKGKSSSIAVATATTDLPSAKPLFWRARGVAGRWKGVSFTSTWQFVVRANAPGVNAARLVTKDDALVEQAKKVSLPRSMSGSPLVALLVGDVNGDGYGDVAVSDSREAALFLGAKDGLTKTPATAKLSAGYGTALAMSGQNEGRGQGVDLNADGFMDYVGHNIQDQTVRIHYGSREGLHQEPDVVLSLPNEAKSKDTFPALGDATAFGDVNGDGYVDIIISDYRGGPTGRGAVFIFFTGKSAPPMLMIDEPESVKQSKANPHWGIMLSAKDENADGIDDITISTACYAEDQSKSLCDGNRSFRYLGSRDGKVRHPTD